MDGEVEDHTPGIEARAAWYRPDRGGAADYPTGIRVVFFLQGLHVPASRVRGMAIARALEAAGVPCQLRICDPSVYGDSSGRLPFAVRRLRPLFYPAALVSRASQLAGLRDDDIVFFQRPLYEWPFAWLERLAARGRRSIFDFDDAIHLNAFGRSKLRAIVGAVDQVIAGNLTLAAAAAAPGKTTVIPSAVDLERYPLPPARPARGSEVVVGWSGSHGNYRQLAVAAEPLGRALARTGARLLLIADRPPPRTLAALRPEYLPWNPEREAADLARIDVGLMPLPDEPYARGKCAFKLLQYMALGRPGVASPVGANAEVVTDGLDGFLPRDPREWEARLVELIDDPALRARMGAAARARVETAYSVSAVLHRYLTVIARLPAAARSR